MIFGRVKGSDREKNKEEPKATTLTYQTSISPSSISHFPLRRLVLRQPFNDYIHVHLPTTLTEKWGSKRLSNTKKSWSFYTPSTRKLLQTHPLRRKMLLFHNHVTAFLLLLSLLGIGPFTSLAAPTYNGHYCPNNATYQSNAAFQNNLNLLISSLATNASEVRDGYFLTNIGLGTADVASGLFLCRGDVTFATCVECVAAAAAEISRRCRNQTESIIWYDECLFGYTNRYFNPVGIEPRVNLWDGNNVSTSNLDSFNRTLFGLLNGLAEEASTSQSAKKFATGERNFSGFSGLTTLYGLAQCAPGLTNALCEKCLKNGIGTIPTCCGGKQGARALLAWCFIRYEWYKFYNTSGTSASPLLPPPSSGK